MKEGRGSRTAVLVCMGRAVGSKSGIVPRFSDPTALALLPEDARARVEAFEAGASPRGLRARVEHGYLRTQSCLMIARTVSIDDGIRAAAAPQVVLLGAGLDGRAWRMEELRDVAVFEVDHPDSQRDKRERAAHLVPVTRDVRFVPVDFTRDSLDLALERAGHDPTRPTTWVWEGVVMYLSPRDVEATLRTVASRSAPGSRLLATYHAPTPVRWLVAIAVRALGEPLRSVYSAGAMRTLLAEHGFAVVSDRGIPAMAAALSPELAARTRFMDHFRLAIADRVAPG